MKSLKIVASILIALSFIVTKSIAQDTLHLQSNELKLVIANNQSYGEIHRSGYSGISELYYDDNSEKSLFVPSFCGLNLEFIFNGDSASYDWDPFEPRKSPMQLIRLGPNKAQLEQSRTEHWPLQSTITYELSGNRVEMTYKGIPLKDAWNKYGYIGLFFASYINMPEDKGIHFIGRRRSDSETSEKKWIYHMSPEHGIAANHRPAGSNWDPSYDSGFPLTLVSGYSEYEYKYPFYYGRAGDHVVIMMFQRMDEYSEMRFAQSPTGGGANHPAWDFIYFNKGFNVDEPFSFKAAMVVKKFKGKEDIIHQYEKWSGGIVE